MPNRSLSRTLTAATAVVISALLLTPPAQAADQGEKCVSGDAKITRCVTIGWDPGNQKFQAFATVRDEEGSYQVRVDKMRFWSHHGSTTYPGKGWDDDFSRVPSRVRPCVDAREKKGHLVHAEASFSWKKETEPDSASGRHDTLKVSRLVCPK